MAQCSFPEQGKKKKKKLEKLEPENIWHWGLKKITQKII